MGMPKNPIYKEVRGLFDDKYNAGRKIYNGDVYVFNGVNTETESPVAIKLKYQPTPGLQNEWDVYQQLMCNTIESQFSGFHNIKYITDPSIKLTVMGYLRQLIEPKSSSNIPSLVYFICIHYFHRPPPINIPKVLWYGYNNRRCNVLAMELLGPSLYELSRSINEKIKLHNILLIAQQMISALEYVHDQGYVHKNIKPGVLLAGYQDDAKQNVYLTDFKQAKKWQVADTNNHIKCIKYTLEERKDKTFRAENADSIVFTSINFDDGYEVSRRDDMESLGYTLLYLLNGSLPWIVYNYADHIRKTWNWFNDDSVSIMKTKKEAVIERVKDIPKEFVHYIMYCRELEFEERPDYGYLRRLFSELAMKEYIDLTNGYDWN